jgi:hypothetical protein
MGTLYDTDILLWSEQQADLLRRLAAGERVNDALDFGNLIEEVEGVGRSERRAVESLLIVALRHLILAHGAPQPDPVRHWLLEAEAALMDARRGATPGMLQRLDLPSLWADARRLAIRKLEVLGGASRPCPEACPFTLGELLSEHADPDALLVKLRSGGA